MNKEKDICLRELLPPKNDMILAEDLSDEQKKTLDERRKEIFKSGNYMTKINGKSQSLKERLDEYDFGNLKF